MKEVVLNPDVVTPKEIEQIKYKARAVVINKNTGEMALNLCFNQYMFPGGGIEQKSEKIEELGKVLQKYKKLSQDEAYNEAYAWVCSKFDEEVKKKQEQNVEGLIREIKEELGIELEKNEVINTPFLKIDRIDKNLPINSGNREAKERATRETITLFYLVLTEKQINTKDKILSPDERRGHLETFSLKMKDAINAVNIKKQTAKSTRNKIYHEEFEIVMQTLREMVQESKAPWTEFVKKQLDEEER